MKSFWKILVLVALCVPKNTRAMNTREMDLPQSENSLSNNHICKKKHAEIYDEDYIKAFFENVCFAIELIDINLANSLFTNSEELRNQFLSIKDAFLKTKRSTEHKESLKSIRRAIGNKAAQQNDSEDTVESHDTNTEQGDLDTAMFQLKSFILPASITEDMNDPKINKRSRLVKNIHKGLNEVRKTVNNEDVDVSGTASCVFEREVEPLIKNDIALQSQLTKKLFQLSDIIRAVDVTDKGKGRQKIIELNKAGGGKTKNFDQIYGNDIGKIERTCKQKKRDSKNNEKQNVKMEEISSKKFEEQKSEKKPRKVLGVIPIPAKLITAKSVLPKITYVSPLELSVEYASSNPKDRGGQISSPKSAEHKQD